MEDLDLEADIDPRTIMVVGKAQQRRDLDVLCLAGPFWFTCTIRLFDFDQKLRQIQ